MTEDQVWWRTRRYQVERAGHAITYTPEMLRFTLPGTTTVSVVIRRWLQPELCMQRWLQGSDIIEEFFPATIEESEVILDNWLTNFEDEAYHQAIARWRAREEAKDAKRMAEEL